MENSNIRIVLTGGHAATTAISTVEEIQKRGSDWELYWIGPKRAIEGKDTLSAASQILPNYGVFYHPIISGRLQKKWSRYTALSLAKVPIGFFHALFLLIKIKPDLVVSYGGYSGFPVVVVASILRIPVVLHSQTVAIGLANKLSVFFCRKIAIARRESRSSLPKNKTVLVGNPVMSSILKVKPKNKIGHPPVVYITGGSTGSQSINEALDGSLAVLLTKYRIIHQCGELGYQHFLERKRQMPSDLAEHYEVFNFNTEIWKVFEEADIIVSRAGANTISEILITGRPTILIPHPWVNLDEQNKNADLVKPTGQFLVLNQSDLGADSLVESIGEVESRWDKMNATTPGELAKLDSTAAVTFVDLLTSCLG